MLLTRWLSETAFYNDDDTYMAVPDPDAEGMDVRECCLFYTSDAADE